MQILRVSVKNYKGFGPAGATATLGPGINVVVGQNNAGKTALLEALSIQFKAGPHRSLATHPTPGALVDNPPVVEAEFELTREEMLGHLADSGSTFVLPAKTADEAVEAFEAAITPRAIMRCRWGGPVPGGELVSYNASGALRYYAVRRPELRLELQDGGRNVTAGFVLYERLATRIYLFNAERYSLGESQYGGSAQLAPNASNLPQVVNGLTANPAAMKRFNELVNRVLPQIKGISPEPVSQTNVRLLVWPFDPMSLDRSDLAIPLSQCGTGVGQVLAILYVVSTSPFSQVIAIDEPQSFLHPGAVRRLIDVLQEYPQHQFLIATHSPSVIAACESPTILFVTSTAGLSGIEVVGRDQNERVRLLLEDLGLRFGDVFGYEHILWVEGRTEEINFPLVLRRLSSRKTAGVAIRGVLATGDLEGRRRALAIEVYERLSATAGFISPTVTFVLDEDDRSGQLEDLRRRFGAKLRVLPRRMYENYLIHPGAIADVARGIDGFGGVGEAEVRDWLDRNRWHVDFFKPRPIPGSRSEAEWLSQVAGDRVLERMFLDLSGGRVPYDKVRHGRLLTEHILSTDPDQLRGLAEFLSSCLPA